MIISKVVLEFLGQVEAYLGEPAGPDTERDVHNVANSFVEWGRSAASGKCNPAVANLIQTASKLMFADSEAMATAMEDFLKKCYTYGCEMSGSR